ncbi:inositol monophosphatase [Rhizobium sp. P32RR-XVIII]|uniref:inositol monophosphatase family protein n=1 Tax=Rhizobium sp. P32RR-XVIII TaxID=2726738 RepID=UPI0014574521|nr:inositol monophosphatase family protein [Rhizobium sp. P32RR-XVIII]NLS08029.1 inositol monophosphatase [Rhizobium sp. P32RR-XVIII]
MIDSDQILSLARTAAVMAGKAVTEQWEQSRQEVRYKGKSDAVSTADLRSKEIISAYIRAEFPSQRILSEEDVESHAFDYSGPLWIIDPIDGTANYVRGHPYFGVSIAFAVDGVVQVGCVHAPALQETFTAIRDRGAFLNGEPIRPSSTDSLARAVVSTGFPHEKGDIAPLLQRIKVLLASCQDIRRSSSPVLDISYVASGRLDAHTETLFPWDIAAAGLIATEAGAIRSNLVPVPDHIPADLWGEEVVFASSGIHGALVAHLLNS